MDWIIHNPLADMYGPDFLVFYFLAIVVLTFICREYPKTLDTTAKLARPQIPTQPNPSQIAYLRGGENEVVRLAIFELMTAGLLEESSKKPQKIGVVPGAVSPSGLAPLQQDILTHFAIPNTPHSIFQSQAMSRIKAGLAPFAQMAEDQGLFTVPEVRQASQKTRGIGAMVILLLGGYKLAAALTNGHNNVGFLVIMGIVGLIVLNVAGRTSRLSLRGKEFLKNLQVAFARLRRPNQYERGAATEYDPALLTVAIFGFAALAGTENAAYARMFQQSAASNGSGNCGGGGSCGSGGCGGGGCGGGGCGGCGG